MTGWNMPPGCNVSDIPGNRPGDETCAVCGQDVDVCPCPECPTCGEYGNPQCYHEHGLKLNREQAIARTHARIAKLKDEIVCEQQYLEWLQSHPEEWLPIELD